MLVLDESLSISAEDLTRTREAAEHFVQAFRYTGTEIGIDAFAVVARPLVAYQAVTTGTEPTFSGALSAAGNGFGNPPSPGGAGTNWQGAFRLVTVQDQTTRPADLVVFMTDGDPNIPATHAGNTETQFNQAIGPAIEAANAVKEQKSHIFPMGVGGLLNERSVERLRWVSGDNKFPEHSDFSTADYTLVSDFVHLGPALGAVAASLCGSSANIVKYVIDEHGGGATRAPDWTFTAKLDTPHTWLGDAAGEGTSHSAMLTTKDRGEVHFARSFPSTESTATLGVTKEAVKEGFELKITTCQFHELLADGVAVERDHPEFGSGPVEGIPGAVLGRDQWLTCQVYNAPRSPGNGGGYENGQSGERVVAEEHVTCVFRSRPRVEPPGTLTIRKVTRGGVGSFDYTLTRTGGVVVAHSRATTTEPEVAVYALPTPVSLTAGHYVIHEVVHNTPEGVWHPDVVTCNGRSQSATRPVDLHVVSGEAITCAFVNVFEPRGSISVAKVTIGGTGTATFLIQPFAGPLFENPTTQFRKHATTTTEHHPYGATPIEAHDATTNLPLGDYWISSQPPISAAPGPSASGAITSADREWVLVSVEINGLFVPFTEGATHLALTPANPHVHVVFTSLLTPIEPIEPEITPEVVPPPLVPKFPPSIFPPEVPGRPAYPLADLSVTKSASATTASAGQVVHYHVTVTDHGPEVARQVVIDDQALGAASIVAIHTPVGHCQVGRPIVCELGAVKAGHGVTITVALRALSPGATLVNRAVVGEASQDPNLTHAVSEARVRIRRPVRRPVRRPPPAVTG